MTGRTSALVFAVGGLLVTLSAPALAQNAGSLDPAFGNGNGMAVADFGGREEAHAIAIDHQNRVVVVGSSDYGGITHWAVARFTSDGKPDTTFGPAMTGQVLTSIRGTATAVEIDANGRILVAGTAFNATDLDFAVARFNADGTPDTGFGSNQDGLSVIGFGPGTFDIVNGMVVDTQGRIVLVGESRIIQPALGNFAIARVDAAGVLDPGFNGSGRLLVPGVVGAAADAVVYDLYGPDWLLVGGAAQIFEEGFVLMLVTASGQVATNSNFGTAGIVLTQFGPNGDGIGYGRALTRDAQGGIFLGGLATHQTTGTFNYDATLARYDVTGVLDGTNFCCGGIVMNELGGNSDEVSSIAIDASGKIVLAATGGGLPSQAFVLRLAPNGQLDTTFGSGGKVTAHPGALRGAASLALDAVGDIVLATSEEAADANFVVMRFFSTPRPADLVLTKVTTTDVVRAGDLITYELRVSNLGPGQASDVTVVDSLPGSLTFSSCTPSCSFSAGAASFQPGAPLPPGGTSVFTLTALVNTGTPGGTEIVNTAVVTSATSDPNPANNTASATSYVESIADLSVSLGTDTRNVKQGDILTYTVTVQNFGPHAANDVRVDDLLSSGTTFVAARANRGHLTTPPAGESGTVSWYLGTLLADGQDSAEIQVTVIARGKGTITNVASVSSAATDPNPANNTASISVSVAAGSSGGKKK